MSGGLEPPQWPPRSPFEAILYSPNSKSRTRERQNRLSTSPSPLKRSAAFSDLKSNAKSQVIREGGDGQDEDEDEDEETLQLRLQTLEAKLKLKKLQSKKAKGTHNASSFEKEEGSTQSTSQLLSTLSAKRERKHISHESLESMASSEIQVPISPERRKPIVQEQRSPGRILLGIDKGLSGRNVSLRRAPNFKTQLAADADAFGGNEVKQGFRTNSSRTGDPRASHTLQGPTGKSFNERISENRDRAKQDNTRKERLERLRRERSTGFGVRQEEIDAFQKASIQDKAQSQAKGNQTDKRSFSRDEVLKAMNKTAGALVRNDTTISSMRRPHQMTFTASNASENCARPKSAASERSSRLQKKDLPHEPSPESAEPTCSNHSTTSGVDAALFEPYSTTNLSRRILPHTFLQRNLDDKTPIVIPTLLRLVKAPDFSLPESMLTKDFVVFGVIASKSSPLSHKENQRTQTQSADLPTSNKEADQSTANERGKFMVFTLTDLKWTIDLYLFMTAYTRFRKLTPGTLVAILNPSIMPPPRHKIDTGRWSLTLSSSEDTILEIGTSKDLAWCKAIKKDGNQCGDWVDCRKTEFCDFHINRNVERTRRGRMEVQGMSVPFAPGGKKSGHAGHFGSSRRKGGGGGGFGDHENGGQRGDGLLREGRQYDRAAQSAYFLAPAPGGHSAASLLDMEEAGDRGGKQERVRRALAEREREGEIARRLGVAGNGAGAAYLRMRHPDGLVDGLDAAGNKDLARVDRSSKIKDASSLGLKGNMAKEVMLSPLKRKCSDAIALTAKKKTRFVTAKGIREAGRDSLGAPGADDDDLIII